MMMFIISYVYEFAFWLSCYKGVGIFLYVPIRVSIIVKVNFFKETAALCCSLMWEKLPDEKNAKYD